MAEQSTVAGRGGQLGDGQGLVGSLGRWSQSHWSLGKLSQNQVGRLASDGQLAGAVGEEKRAGWVSGGTTSGKVEEMGGRHNLL